MTISSGSFKSFSIASRLSKRSPPFRSKAELPGPSPLPLHTATFPNPLRKDSVAPFHVQPVSSSVATTSVK